MCEFPIDLLIKQTLRSVVFDSTNMGIMSSRAQHFQSKTNSNSTQSSIETAFCSLLRSPESIKWLFERPNDYMYKIFENEAFKDAIDTAKSETELKVVKHRILYGFLKELRDSRPPQAMEWIAFQHYVYFVYRNFLTPKPIVSNEALPNILVKKMYELIISLTFEDKTQFYVRIITLLREYVMSALDNYEEISATADTTTYLKCLLSYYSAFCSAANKLSTVLSEFDQFMNDKFNINWYCLNQRMFFQYFFMVGSVQCKVPSFNKLVDANKPCNRELIKSYNAFIEDMSVLGRHWDLQRQRISVISGRNTKEESQWLQKDWKMFEEITKIMKTNFWIIRNNEWKTTHETDDLDGHFLAIVEDTWHVADRLIAPEGNCICEDCMTAEFQQDLITGSVQQPFGSSKLVMCYICHDVLSLEILGSHIVSKHSDLTIPRADLTKSYKWQISSPSIKKAFPIKRPSTKLCKVLSETMELAKNKEAQLFKVNEGTFKIKTDPESKEPITKRLLECPARNGSDPVLKFNDNGIKFPTIPGIKIPTEPLINLNCSSPNDLSKMNMKSHKEPVMKIASEPPIFAANNFSDEMEGCRAAFQEFVKSRTEGNDLQNRLGEKKEIKKATLEKKDDCQVDVVSNAVPNDCSLLPWHLRRNQGNNSDTKVFDFLRNGNSPKPSPPAALVSNKPTDNGCAGHVCGHKCKKEDEVQTGGKKTCQDTCDHHKEPKKCDCAYCEVFGSTVAAHSHKTNETRDRLRIRLSQRKEKINEYLKGSKNGANPKAVESESTQQAPVINTKPPLGPKVSVTNNPNTKLTTNGSGTCSHNKTTSCQNCVPINIKILSNSADVKTNVQTVENTEVVEPKPKNTVAPAKSLTDLPDLSDIDGLLDFIQGNKPIDKIAMAQKKAAKKARQKLKKEQEKQRKEAEEEERRREEERMKEEKRREEERLKAQELARQQAEQMKKSKRNKIENRLQQESTKSSKKKGKNKVQKDTESMEETIPAMVTIKRIVENNNSPPTVTITLKGSTPDQDKLLYTLVNGHTSEYLMNNNSENNKSKKKNKNQAEQQNKLNDLNSEGKKKKKKIPSSPNVSNSLITTKELKVTLAVDKSFHKGKEVVESIKKVKKQNLQKSDKNPRNEQKKNDTNIQPKPALRDNVIDIPSLKLPPGITITKVNGPLTNKNCKSSTNSAQSSTPTQYQNVPVSKSGVIVVDTEKLIQQSITATSNKKNKKKKNRNKLSTDKSENENTSEMNSRNSDSKPAMVTLKNPIFHTLQTKLVEKSEIPIIPYNEQASITQGENGMVTIRRPRCLQLPRDKESPMTEFLSELKPVIGPNVALTNRKLKDIEHKTYSLSNGHGAFLTNVNLENGICETPYTQNFTQNGVHIDLSNSFIHNVSDSNKSGLSAQDILWGLPGIEITKVNKNAISNDHDNKKSCQTADVSIIPTRTGINNGEKFNFDRDDWPFESVFAPKDILEDDLDADERELEAFKRFCQQSVPPLHKEKVAHLNVKDIILKKKNDVAYS